MIPEIDTVEEFESIHNPDQEGYGNRYKVFYGGRGGRKSWEIARAFILEAVKKKTLILCTREIQNSINDSVLRLLSAQIEMLGLGFFFDVQKTTIIAKNGSEFVFKGLNGMTIDSIKSFEGADFCWVEEAHSVSEKSWSILIPTIRKPGSKIYISFNPDLPTDPVYKRFVLNTPPSTTLVHVNYTQNPDAPQELLDEAEYLRKVDYEAYSHVYLGNVRAHSDAQVFAKKYVVQPFELDESFGEPLLGADWGFSVDPTTLIKSYIHNNTLYVRSEAYKVNCEVDHTPDLFKSVDQSKDYSILADSARPEMISFLKRAGYKIKAAEKWSGCVEDRVTYMRSFEQIVIHPDCKHTAEEFRLYQYKTDKRTDEVLPKLDDKHNHCIDAIGYSITPIIRKKQSNWTIT